MVKRFTDIFMDINRIQSLTSRLALHFITGYWTDASMWRLSL